MNHNIVIGRLDQENPCFAQLYTFSGLPFDESKAELKETITNPFYGELVKDVAAKGWFDLMNKNE